MRIIALTSANKAAMALVAEELAAASRNQGLQLLVLQGVEDAAQAAAVYADHGELWCVGDEAPHEELGPMVDRYITDESADATRAAARKALQACLSKTVVAV